MTDPVADFGIPRRVDALIRRAIAEKLKIRCVFKGRERIGEPHDYGVMKGQAELFLWQTGGLSSQGSLPGWRPIHWPDADDFSILEGQHFPGQRPPPSGSHRVWDEIWARVSPSAPGPRSTPAARRPMPSSPASKKRAPREHAR